MVRIRYKPALSACFTIVSIITYCSGCGNNITQEQPFDKGTTEPAAVIMIPEEPPEMSIETDPEAPATESHIPEQQPAIIQIPLISPSVTTTNPHPEYDPYYDSSEYFLAAQDLALEELSFIFGEGYISQSPRKFIDKYGEPIEKRHFKGEEWQDVDRVGIWRFPQGFEINVGTMNDYPIIEDYIYFPPECELKMSTGVGIGSTRAELLSTYGEMINPKLQTDTRIAIGREIYFLLKCNVVESIYFSTFGFDAERYFIPGD